MADIPNPSIKINIPSLNDYLEGQAVPFIGDPQKPFSGLVAP
jgi:hypothetical protein